MNDTQILFAIMAACAAMMATPLGVAYFIADQLGNRIDAFRADVSTCFDDVRSDIRELRGDVARVSDRVDRLERPA